MKSMDIELLLQWAVNDELPKGNHVENSVWRSIDKYMPHNAPVDKFNAERARVAAVARARINQLSCIYVPGEPHPDAVLIGKAVKSLNYHAGIDDEKSILALLGTLANIDRRDPQGRLPCVTVAMAVTPNVAGLLMTCAILKRRPFLSPTPPKPMPVRRTNGRPLALREDVDGNLIEATVQHWRNDYVGSPRCPLEWGNPTIEDVAEERAEYAIWRRGLALLAKQLTRELANHIALPPAAEINPWSAPPRRQPRLWRGAA
jgi:hypothetical protein